MKLSIVIPAYNEEAYLGATLDSLRIAAEGLRARAGAEVEMIVVDNNSRDRTAPVAREQGATVVHEPVQLIARARNAGAHRASGDVLVFVDADVIVPPEFLILIHEAMSDPACIGGGVDTAWRARRLSVRLYLGAWWLLVRLTGMVLGAAQFARREAFEQVGGYDERAWIGEDVDFVWRLGRLGRRPAGGSGGFGSRPSGLLPGASTTGLSGKSWSGPIRLSLGCSGGGSRCGAGGIRGRCGSRKYALHAGRQYAVPPACGGRCRCEHRRSLSRDLPPRGPGGAGGFEVRFKSS